MLLLLLKAMLQILGQLNNYQKRHYEQDGRKSDILV